MEYAAKQGCWEKNAKQRCRERLLGKIAGQSWRAMMLGKAAVKGC
jgi:hypothetical protein